MIKKIVEMVKRKRKEEEGNELLVGRRKSK
jgi:hypothetical protein